MRRGGDDAEGRGGGRKLPWSGDFGERAPTKKDQGASPLNSLNLNDLTLSVTCVV